MNDFVAKFKLAEQEPINATFKLDLIPSKVSQLENDLGFVKKEDITLPDISELVTKTDFENTIDDLNFALNEKQPKGDYLTEHQDISHLASKSDIPDTSVFALKSDVDNVLAEIEQLLSEV